MSTITTHGGLPEKWSKSQLESLIKDLGRDGLRLTRVAFDLLKHVVRFAAERDFQPGRVCGNWEKVEDLAATLGATPRSILDAEKLLEAKGLILRTAGRNGYRGVRKCQGLIVRLSGINIGPLIDSIKSLTELLNARAFEARAVEQLIRHHSLDHPGLEFPGQGHGDGLGASPGFISVIGGLLPMAPCGRSSL